MNTATLPPFISALLAQCRATHEQDVATAGLQTKAVARRLAQGVARGTVSTDDVECLVAYGCTPQPDESRESFQARRRGLAEGLVAGFIDLADRRTTP